MDASELRIELALDPQAWSLTLRPSSGVSGEDERFPQPLPFTAQDLDLFERALDLNGGRNLQRAFSAEEIAQLAELNLLRTHNPPADALLSGLDIHREQLREQVRVWLAGMLLEPLGAWINEHFAAQRTADRNRRPILYLRLEFRPDRDAPLLRLPWELLHQQHRLTKGDIQVGRYLRYDAAPGLPAPAARLQLLVLESDPVDDTLLRLNLSESERIRAGLNDPPLADRFVLKPIKPASYRQAQDAIHALRGQPAIFHFAGHGDFGWRCEGCGRVANTREGNPCGGRDCGFQRHGEPKGFLAFTNPEGGRADWIGSEGLRNLLKRADVRLVVLNACKSATGRGGAAVFNGLAQQLMDIVPAVVATPFPLATKAAEEFARLLYRELSDGLPLVEALHRVQEALAEPYPDEWYRPVLYLRSQQGDGGRLLKGAPAHRAPKSAGGVTPHPLKQTGGAEGGLHPSTGKGRGHNGHAARHKAESPIYDSPLKFRDWIIVAVLCKCSSAAIARRLPHPTMDLSHLIADPGTWESDPKIYQSMLGIAREIAGIESSQVSDEDLRELTAEELMSISTNSCFKSACKLVKEQYQMDMEQKLLIVPNLQQASAEGRPLTSDELKRIYAFTSILRAPSQMGRYTITSFGKLPWWKIILRVQDVSDSAVHKSHLHYSNLLLAKEVKYHFRNTFHDFVDHRLLGRKTPLRILEGGVGGANTTHALIHQLDMSWKDSHMDSYRFVVGDRLPVEYRGYEINPLFAVIANEILSGKACETDYGLGIDPRASFFAKRPLIPWPDNVGTRWDLRDAPCPTPSLVVGKNLINGFSELAAESSFRGTVHLVVLSFVFHHVPNGYAFRKYLFNDAFKSAGLSSQPLVVDSYKNLLDKAIYYAKRDPSIRHPDIPDDISQHAFILSEYMGELNASAYRDMCNFFGKSRNPEDVPDSAQQLFHDSQRTTLSDAYQLLTPGGILAIADPDGFSGFNKVMVLKDVEMSVAHFLERMQLVKLLSAVGFQVIGRMDLVKMRGDSDVYSHVSRSDDEPPVSNNPNFADGNLGYLVICQKPFSDRVHEVITMTDATKRQGGSTDHWNTPDTTLVESEDKTPPGGNAGTADTETPAISKDHDWRLQAPNCWKRLPDYQEAEESIAVLNLLYNYPKEFQELFQPPSYQRLLGSLSIATLNALIPDKSELDKSANVLEQLHVIRRDSIGWDACCRLNVLQHPRLYVATDPPALDYKGRVFPFEDEAETLLRFLRPIIDDRTPERILDLCCGPGHIGLWLAKYYKGRPHTVGIDNDASAIDYARFNARLNGLDEYRTAIWDLHKGIDSFPLRPAIGCFDLITADPPFTSAPPWMTPPRHSSAGERGEMLTQDLLSLVATLLAPGGRFAMITYTLDGDKGPQRLNEQIQSIFKGTDIKAEEPLVMPNVFLWRLHGAKRFWGNPMPVQYMAPRYFDNNYLNDKERNVHSYDEYISWIEKALIKQGLTNLYYVFLTAARLTN
ncbi:MAG: CHAT domain-containing protein [Terriglobia bacterium]